MVDAPQDLKPPAQRDRIERGELGISTGKGFYDYQGKSAQEMQRKRNAELWRVVASLADLVQGPEPL